MTLKALGAATLVALLGVQVQRQADPLTSGIDLGTDATVLVVMAWDCPPCLASLPFYKSLLALPGMDGQERRLVVLAQRGVVMMDIELKARQFKPHLVSSGPRATHDVPVLPTVIVVGADGRRRGLWAGSLTPAQEKEVLAAVGVR